MQSNSVRQNRIGGVYEIHPASSNDHDINRTGHQGVPQPFT